MIPENRLKSLHSREEAEMAEKSEVHRKQPKQSALQGGVTVMDFIEVIWAVMKELPAVSRQNVSKSQGIKVSCS